MSNKIEVPIDTYMYEIKSERAIEWESNKSEEYKEYRVKWSHNPQNFIEEDGPLNLDIETTNACNLRCTMCPRTAIEKFSVNDNFKLGYMDINLYKNLIDQAIDIGVKAIKLNWRGEPTIHKNIIEMIHYAKDKGILDVIILNLMNK